MANISENGFLVSTFNGTENLDDGEVIVTHYDCDTQIISKRDIPLLELIRICEEHECRR